MTPSRRWCPRRTTPTRPGRRPGPGAVCPHACAQGRLKAVRTHCALRAVTELDGVPVRHPTRRARASRPETHAGRVHRARSTSVRAPRCGLLRIRTAPLPDDASSVRAPRRLTCQRCSRPTEGHAAVAGDLGTPAVRAPGCSRAPMFGAPNEGVHHKRHQDLKNTRPTRGRHDTVQPQPACVVFRW